MTTYQTLSDDRHSLLCVSEVLGHVIRGDGKNITGAAELAEKALREVIDNMGAVEDAGYEPSEVPVNYTILHQRMADLEDSYQNAPKITAGTLDQWLGRVRSLDQYLTAAMDTVCLLNADERDATDYYGPLKAIETTLEQACEEATGLSIVVTAASRKVGQVSFVIADRLEAWREARTAYDTAEASDDATMDPLHDAKQEAYDALLETPVQTFGDVLAMARTIKEEDSMGTRDASPHEPAFNALIAGIEALAGGADQEGG